MGNVRCGGNESSLFECTFVTSGHEEVSQCDPNEVSAVSCLGKKIIFELYQLDPVCFYTDSSTKFANCRTGEVRFTDSANNTEEDSLQGTIQICVNNAWGSVCNDNFFDHTDAEVFCDQLVGFSADGMQYNIECVHDYNNSYKFQGLLNWKGQLESPVQLLYSSALWAVMRWTILC